MKKILIAIFGFALTLTLASQSSAATLSVYDALPSVDPATSYPSQPFQAQQVKEFGDQIHLSSTSSTSTLKDVTFTFVTWAKYTDYSNDSRYFANLQGWYHPVTVNIYEADLNASGTPNTLLATKTQNVFVPWRPASSTSCSNDMWMDSAGKCNNGYAFNATFDLSNLELDLPDDVIVTVAFNTQSWGYAPIGVEGPYNSLNIAVPENNTVKVGSNDSDSVFLNSTWTGAFTNPLLAGQGLQRDLGWTPYGTVAIKVNVDVDDTTTPPTPTPTTPSSKDQCKNGGWKSFTNPSFKKSRSVCKLY